MKGRFITNVTPQDKIVAVNNKLGNSNIRSQQGTTRVLFDTIELDGRQEFRFFENSGSKQYPFTNVGAEGNRLNVGDTFVVQKIYFGILTTDPDTGLVENFESFNVAGWAKYMKGELSFQIANSQVIKQLPIEWSYDSVFNPTGENPRDLALGTFTDIVIPPLLEYVLSYRTIAYTAVANTRLVCFIEGTAGIIAPQTTF
jgi:hypothetical protein